MVSESKSDLEKRLEGMDLVNQLREIIFVLDDFDKRLERLGEKLKEILEHRKE